MIVNLTAQDRKQIEKIDAEYRKKISETEALIESLRPGDTGPKGPKSALSGTPEAEEMERSYKDWLDSGSQEWRDARKELSRLIAEQSETINSKFREIEKREFSKLGGDREKIIQSARDQISLMIDNRFDNAQKIIKTHKNDDGEEISGFSARYLRVDGKDIYLDIEETIKDCKQSLLKLHYEALSEDQEAVNIIDDLVLSIVTDSPKTSSDKGVLGEMIKFKKPKKARSKKDLPTFSENIEPDFFMFSTTPAKDVLYNLLSHDSDVEKTAQTIKAISKRTTKQYNGENSKAIQVESKNAVTIIELLGSACQKVNSRTAKKILHFIESELYQRVYYKGKMHDDLVTFPLQKMVDKKLYTSAQNARRAFYDASNVLTALRVSATLKSGKKEVSISEGNGRVVLFPTMIVENGQCVVRLNRDINWSPFLKDFFLMPDSWWALPDNASDLEYEIFRNIRMKKEKLDKDGTLSFNLKLSSVASWLNLPLNTKNPKRNVKDPIEIAVKQIVNSLDSNNFKLDIDTDLNASLAEYLEGNLKVTVSGVYSQNLIGLNDKHQAKIEEALRRKEEIIKEASIRKLAEEMKEDEKTVAE